MLPWFFTSKVRWQEWLSNLINYTIFLLTKNIDQLNCLLLENSEHLSVVIDDQFSKLRLYSPYLGYYPLHMNLNWSAHLIKFLLKFIEHILSLRTWNSCWLNNWWYLKLIRINLLIFNNYNRLRCPKNSHQISMGTMIAIEFHATQAIFNLRVKIGEWLSMG